MSRIPPPVNEPIKSYAPDLPERASLKKRLETMACERVDIPIVVGGEHISTGEIGRVSMPHDHAHTLGSFHLATPGDRHARGRRGRRRSQRLVAMAVRRSRGRSRSRPRNC